MLKKYCIITILIISSFNTCYPMVVRMYPPSKEGRISHYCDTRYRTFKSKEEELSFLCSCKTVVFSETLACQFPVEHYSHLTDLARMCGGKQDNTTCALLVGIVNELTVQRQEECPPVLEKAKEVTENLIRSGMKCRDLDSEEPFLWRLRRIVPSKEWSRNGRALHNLNQSSLCLNFFDREVNGTFALDTCLIGDRGFDYSCRNFIKALDKRAENYRTETLLKAAQELQGAVSNYNAYMADKKEQD